MTGQHRALAPRPLHAKAKTCRRCGEQKPPSAFHLDPHGRDGLHAVCRPCRRSQEIARYQTEAELHKARSRAWSAKNRQRRADYQREWSAANREKKLRYAAAWKARNPGFDKIGSPARAKVRWAVKRGDLVKAAACQWCAGQPVEAAHSDYTKPLQVLWLCRPCHRRWDRAEPKTVRYD